MAGSDSKTNRALAQTSSRGDIDADEDPLVELARIVSEDGGFSGSRAGKPKLARSEPSSRDSLADGLEAELLQELETSFAAREPEPARAPVPLRSNPPPAAVAPSPPPSDEPDPDELLRSIEEQLSQFERRQAGRFSTVAGTFTPEVADAEADASPASDEEPEDLPFGAPSKGAEPRGERPGLQARPLAEDFEVAEEGAEVVPEPVFDAPQAPPPRPEYRFRGPASAEWDRASASRSESPVQRSTITSRRREETPPLNDRSDEAAFSAMESTPSPRVAVGFRAGANGARPNRGDAEAPKPVRPEHRATAFPEFDEPAVAESPAPDFAGIEAELSRELEPSYAPAPSDDKWEDGDAAVEEPRVAAAIAPGPSRRAAAARAAAAHRGRSRLGLFAAAVILVVLIGGAGAFYLRSSETAPSGPPPVIAAEPGAVRVDASPEQTASNGETVGEAVYNRVAGTAPPTEEQVVESAEEPREIARIVLPQSQTPDEGVLQPLGEEDGSTAAADPATPAAASTESAPTPLAAALAEDELGPRRVPTFVVKADGSIVATSEAGATAPDPAAAQDQQLTSETEPIEPVPVPTVAIAEAGASASDAAGSAPVPTPPEESVANVETRSTIEELPVDVAAAPAAPASEPAPEPAPAELAAVAPAEPVAPTSAGGGFLVQLSSEGSMADAQAAYTRAQRRFPSVLGSLEPQIQQADLGAKGIFYRVRVGPWATRAEAIQVCETLKAAGGNCFVAR